MLGRAQAGRAGSVVVQTILFQDVILDPQRQVQAFVNPVQGYLAESFPLSCGLVALSAVSGAPRGSLALVHRILVDGQELSVYEHPPAAVTVAGMGLSFRLELKELQIAQPCVLTIQAEVPGMAKGADVSLVVAPQDAIRAARPGSGWKA